MIGQQDYKNSLNTMLVTKGDSDGVLLPVLNSIEYVNQVYQCGQISEAIKIGNEHHIDLLIVDFFLRDGTVLEFLQQLKSLSLLKAPVIVMVNEAYEAFRLCAYRKGVSLVLIQDKHEKFVPYLKNFIKKIAKSSQDDIVMNPPFSSINDAFIGLNEALEVAFINSSAIGYLGSNCNDLIGQPLEQAFKSLDPCLTEYVLEGISLSYASHQSQLIGTFKLSNIEHHLAHTEVMLYPMLREKETVSGYIISFTEQQDLTKLEGNRFQSHEYDTLTTTLTREAFLSRLEYTLNYCHRYQQMSAVLHIDIDGFKAINDALGYRIADQVLKKVADRIKDITRNVDILARIGTDEFMLLLTYIEHVEDAACVADKLMKLFKEPIKINEYAHFITLSVGVAIFEQDAKKQDELMQCAHSALLLAKDKGRNNYQFYKPEITKSASSTIAIANDLHLAMNTGQFTVHYQPQFCAKTRKVIGAEALIRWKHPEKGMISPALFIPIAEQMGMINDIGRGVIKQVCNDLKRFNDNNLADYSFAINLSIQQFMQEEFIKDIQGIIQEHNVNPKQLEFEITESLFAEDKQFIIDKVTQLKAIGCRMMLDDFGTGYSSLSYLKDLPIEGIKIDRSFVQALHTEDKEKYEAILLAIITLATQLNLKTLAEGIETEQQAEILASLGCDYFQGFLFAKPLTLDDTIQFLKAPKGLDGMSNVV